MNNLVEQLSEIDDIPMNDINNIRNIFNTVLSKEKEDEERGI